MNKDIRLIIQYIRPIYRKLGFATTFPLIDPKQDGMIIPEFGCQDPNAHAAAACLDHAGEDVCLPLSAAGLELLEQLQHLVNREGRMGRVVVDPLEIGVGFVFHFASHSALRVGEQRGNIPAPHLLNGVVGRYDGGGRGRRWARWRWAGRQRRGHAQSWEGRLCPTQRAGRGVGRHTEHSGRTKTEIIIYTVYTGTILISADREMILFFVSTNQYIL
jgi:hypothetical protein